MRSQNCSQESNKNTMIQKKYDFFKLPSSNVYTTNKCDLFNSITLAILQVLQSPTTSL